MGIEKSGSARELHLNRSTLTVIVPAYNEELHLEPTVEKIAAVAPWYFESFEILIFNDGSTDRTAEVADACARRFANTNAIHHTRSVSLGGVFQSGLKRAQGEYVIMIHGQNDITTDNLHSIFAARAPGLDLVIPYQTNTHERPWFRRLLSKSFVYSLNALFGLRLRYYNHYVLFRRDVLKDLRFYGYGYAFQAEILIRLLRGRGCSFRQVPVRDDFSNKTKSNALRWRNITAVFRFYLFTLKDAWRGAL